MKLVWRDNVLEIIVVWRYKELDSSVGVKCLKLVWGDKLLETSVVGSTT